MEEPRDATILILDDDKDIVQTIKANLELDGYRVLCAYDGKSGLEMARERRPDLLILDLSLPDIDGIIVCRRLRREMDLPIIMLTAREGISDKVLGLECGADDYMVKPFNFLELSARIKAILRRFRKAVVKDQCVVKDLTINFRTRTVYVKGEEVKLTKTEFELLGLFVSHPNEVLTRKFIQDQLWRDSQLYKWSRTVDVYVQRLRKKIEPDPENPQYIITVSGVGYKFNAD